MPLSQKLYNSRTIDIYLRYLSESYPRVDIDECLSSAGIQPYQVADPSHWFTQEETDTLISKMIELSGNPNLPREVGRYSASADGNAIQAFWLGLLGPQKVFEAVGRFLPHLVKSSHYSGSAIGTSKAEIVVRPYRGVEEKLYQCQNRLGYIEAVPLHYSRSLPSIEHPECIFKGDDCCRYLVAWKKPHNARLCTLRKALTVIAIPALTAGFFLDPVLALQTLLPITLSLLLILSVFIEKSDKQELFGSLKKLRDSSERLSAQIDFSYNSSLAATEIGQTITGPSNRGDVLDRVLDVFKKRLDFDRGSIMLLDPKNDTLRCRTIFGYDQTQAKFLKQAVFDLKEPSQEVFSRCIKEKTPILVDGDRREFSAGSRSFFMRKLGAHSFIACPILVDDQAIGVLAVDNISSKRPLLQSDVSLLMGIAPVIGVNVQNSYLLDAQERQMTSVLETLAATIDARDPMTAGHSLKVTEYSVGICKELELDKETVEVVRVAALLHDYGKIGVPDAVLKKEGRLTGEEYEIVKTHTIRTKEILDRINFEGKLQPVPAIASSHHEKYDGSGYPLGLKGEDIPLGSRIIAVADFFEALTSERHYRKPMDPEYVIDLLLERCGSHFDNEVVDAFLRVHKNGKNVKNQESIGKVALLNP